jgi:flagellar basal-body rod protein FlgG
MSKDLYPALTGAVATWNQINIISNNLSNVSTNGYKAKRIAFEAYGESKGLMADGYTAMSKMKNDESVGTMMLDGVDTHFAINGKGHFAVESRDGEVLLMRNGLFQFDNEGYLVNSMGEKVLADGGGHIQMNQDEQILNVTKLGEILDQNGSARARLMILQTDETEALMGTRFRGSNMQDVSGSVEILQGTLEASNTNPFREMIEMMQATRYFETFQKVMTTSAELDQKLNQSSKRS